MRNGGWTTRLVSTTVSVGDALLKYGPILIPITRLSSLVPSRAWDAPSGFNSRCLYLLRDFRFIMYHEWKKWAQTNSLRGAEEYCNIRLTSNKNYHQWTSRLILSARRLVGFTVYFLWVLQSTQFCPRGTSPRNNRRRIRAGTETWMGPIRIDMTVRNVFRNFLLPSAHSLT